MQVAMDAATLKAKAIVEVFDNVVCGIRGILGTYVGILIDSRLGLVGRSSNNKLLS
jgi:hypothetical protein